MKKDLLFKLSRLISVLLLLTMIAYAVTMALGILITLYAVMCSTYALPFPEQFGQLDLAVHSYAELQLFALAMLVACGFYCAATWQARRLFSCIACQHPPFSPENARRIRYIALFYTLGVLVPIPPADSFLQSFWSALPIGLILLCISLLFDYACSLQQEVDGLL